jgi:mRNA-degrading endonuclease RelE of RelBE toxin-antitoxin system
VEVDVAFTLQIVQSAVTELQAFKPYYRRQIVSAIEAQLYDQPTVPTRHRKPLSVAEASFTFEPPLWELRVGDVRVFYDVDQQQRTVYIRAVRAKPPHAATEEVL